MQMENKEEPMSPEEEEATLQQPLGLLETSDMPSDIHPWVCGRRPTT